MVFLFWMLAGMGSKVQCNQIESFWAFVEVLKLIGYRGVDKIGEEMPYRAGDRLQLNRLSTRHETWMR